MIPRGETQNADLKDKLLFWKFSFFNVASMDTKVTDNHVFERMCGKIGDIFVAIYHALKWRGSDFFASFLSLMYNILHGDQVIQPLRY